MTEANENSLAGRIISSGQPDFEGRFIFWSGGVAILKIGKDGFWVRGVKVEQGPGEAEEVYNAFKSYLGVR